MRAPTADTFSAVSIGTSIETAVPLHALAAVGTSPDVRREDYGTVDRQPPGSRRQGHPIPLFHARYGPRGMPAAVHGAGNAEVLGHQVGGKGPGVLPGEPVRRDRREYDLRPPSMLQPYVDDETRMMLAEICLDYLERFGDMAPKSGVFADTQMEENAWTAHGLAACYLFLSGHGQAEAWETCARRWMFSACATPQDRFNEGALESGLTGRCADRQDVYHAA